MEGWIKLHRAMREWQHYRDLAVKSVFIDLLLGAAYEPDTFKGVPLEAGEIATSISELNRTTGLSRPTIIKALRVLEESGEIERKRLKNFTTIKICKFAHYQAFIGEGSKNILPPTEKGSKVGSKNILPPTPYNIKEVKNNCDVDTRARTREELVKAATTQLKVERGCMTLKITEEQYRRLVDTIVAEWDYADENDWSLRHLLYTMRYRVNEARSNLKSNGINTTNHREAASAASNPLTRAKVFKAY